MFTIKNEIIKKQILTIIRSIKQKDGSKNSDFDFDQIAELLKVIELRGDEASNDTVRHLQAEIDCALLGTICIGMFSIALINKRTKIEIFPKNWISKTNSPDPNYLFHSLFAQISNTSLAIIALSQKGLDSQARALVRTFMESTALILILLDNQDLAKIYTNSKAMNRQIWNKYFSPGNLGKKLSEIDEVLGIDDDMIYAFNKRKEKMFEFYSSSVHSTYDSIVLFLYSFPFEDGEDFQTSIWGKVSKTSLQTLRDLNWYSHYFVLIIDALLTKKMKFLIPQNDDNWSTTENIKNVYLQLCENNPKLLGD